MSKQDIIDILVSLLIWAALGFCGYMAGLALAERSSAEDVSVTTASRPAPAYRQGGFDAPVARRWQGLA